MHFYRCCEELPLVKENSFRGRPADMAPLPRFEDVGHLLPEPFWKGREDVMRCYRRAWELAFANLKQPVEGSGFIANYADTAFNGHLFLWDSVFILMFGRYGERAFPFQRTLDNFYALQHGDGFICRELIPSTGDDAFERADPSSTGPDLFAWSEWEHYLQTGDRERLGAVFPVLLAYHEWLAKWRTWKDGTYFSSGWGCGMDNQPRTPAGCHPWWDHGHMTWIDTTIQAVFSAELLELIAAETGRQSEAAGVSEERRNLIRLINTELWNEETAFYADRFRDGSLSGVKSVGAFWALLAGIVAENRRESFVTHLRNPAEFARPHMVPSLSADHPEYRGDGGYWKGSVWPSTNYMVIRGLDRSGEDTLAHQIARNHLERVVETFVSSGTLWENYAPEKAAPGSEAKPEFVGWTGIVPITVLFEYVFGLRPDVPGGKLVWDVRLLEEHGVRNYPFGKTGTLDLRCPARTAASVRPQVRVRTAVPLTLELRWDGGRRKEELVCRPE